MKNVWIISKYAVSPTWGYPTRQFLYAKHLHNLGYKVTLISSVSCGIIKKDYTTNSSLFSKQYTDGVEHIILNGPSINLGFSMKRIWSWIIFEINLFRFSNRTVIKPDSIIVSSLSLLTILNGVRFKRKFKSKLIFEIRDIWPITLCEMGNFSKFNPIIICLRWIEKYGYKSSDIVVGSMPNLIEHVRNSVSTKVPVKWMPMGFDQDVFNTIVSDENLSKLNLTSEKFIVGYAGALGKANCVHEIVEAADILKGNTSIHFLILGEGPERSNLLKQSSHLNNVTFIDKVPKHVVPHYMGQCDLLLNLWKKSPLYRFGISPNKWIDYMYCAKPILVCYEGFPCIINEANCGEFIAANNAQNLANKILEYAAKDKTELEAMGNRGKKYLMEKLDYSVLAKQYADLL